MRLQKRMMKSFLINKMSGFKKKANQEKEDYLKRMSEEYEMDLEEVKEIYEMLGEDDFALEDVLEQALEAKHAMEHEDNNPTPTAEDLKEWRGYWD